MIVFPSGLFTTDIVRHLSVAHAFDKKSSIHLQVYISLSF